MNKYVYSVRNEQELYITVFADTEEEARVRLENNDYDDTDIQSDDYLLDEAELDEVEEDV